MKEPKYETLYELKKGTKEWDLQFDILLGEVTTKTAAKAFVRDKISWRKFRKINEKMLSKHARAWKKLYVLAGIDETSSRLRIHRVGDEVFLQIEIEPDTDI